MYSNPSEKVPLTNPNLHFPGGDVDERSTNQASEFLDKIADDNVNEAFARLRDLRRLELARWRSISGHEPVFKAFTQLGETWAHECCPDDGLAKHVALIGLHQTIAFNSKTHLLPLNLKGMAPAVDDLRGLSPIEVFEFSQTNWAGMAMSHQRTFAALSRWHAYLVNLLKPSDTTEHLLAATVGVPYALAVTTRMQNYLLRDTDRQAEVLVKRLQADE